MIQHGWRVIGFSTLICLLAAITYLGVTLTGLPGGGPSCLLPPTRRAAAERADLQSPAGSRRGLSMTFPTYARAPW